MDLIVESIVGHLRNDIVALYSILMPLIVLSTVIFSTTLIHFCLSASAAYRASLSWILVLFTWLTVSLPAVILVIVLDIWTKAHVAGNQVGRPTFARKTETHEKGLGRVMLNDMRRLKSSRK